MIYVGPHIATGQLNPDAAKAWGLVQASRQQRGYGGGGFSVRTMKGILGTLKANNISAQARAQAEQYRQDYGAQMMSTIGCTS